MARILVIDDDESLLQMMSLMLKRAGHQTIQATNGHEGIEIARREQPDAAIVDVMMPELSGYEVCRILREDSRTADIPLLILTALSQREHREHAQDSGADDFVTKPVTRDDLVTHVEDLLRTGARNTPAPVIQPSAPPARPVGSVPGAPTAPVEPPPAPAVPAPQVAPVPQPLTEFFQPPPARTTFPLVAVMGLGSGVGTTTLAVNLGLGLMQFGRSCVIDLHQQSGQVAVQLKMVPPRATWVDLASVQPGGDKRQIGQALMMDHRAGVAILAAPLGATREQLSAPVLNYIFGTLSEGFRRIVADVPTQLNDMTMGTLNSASHIVLVVGDDPSDLMTVPSLLKSIANLRLPGSQHIVINRTRPSGVTHEQVMQAINQPVTADIPYEPGQVAALTEGTPLVMSRPDSLFSRAVLYLARQL